jgi:hypothetical protein
LKSRFVSEKTMKKLHQSLLALPLMLALLVPSLADTIKLKDGSVIHGQVVGFKDGQFTVLIGSGAKGRRSRTLIYVEDIESIEFDESSGAGSTINDDARNDSRNDPRNDQRNDPRNDPRNDQRNDPRNDSRSTDPVNQPVNPNPQSSTAPTFFTIRVSVRGDSANNGWTNSGLVVRRGQRLRITATGRVDLGRRGFSTPSGIPLATDNDRLMRTEATGALIGVIGDDNDEFILIGPRREFVVQRDGVLFLGVNEGDLSDNRGAYDVVIEAEAGSGGPR